MPRALVTGATGLVGSHIVDRLLADGWSVRALVRRPAPELSARGVELVIGDILDVASFERAAETCNTIFHTAAAVTAGGGWEGFGRPNIDGTRHAIQAAERAGARLVQLSSVAVYGRRYLDPSKKIDEDTPLGPLPPEAYYARSKRESEQLVMEAHAAGRIWATAVRPDVIYGERDRQFVPRAARWLRHGFAPLIGLGETTLPIVNAANVADGAVRAALHDGAGGRAYNLANDFDVRVRRFFELAGRGLGREVRFVRVPLPLARGVFAALLWFLHRFAGMRGSVVSQDSLNMVTRDNPYDSSRARRELGWSPRVTPEDGIPAAFRWWRDHNLK